MLNLVMNNKRERIMNKIKKIGCKMVKLSMRGKNERKLMKLRKKSDELWKRLVLS